MRRIPAFSIAFLLMSAAAALAASDDDPYAPTVDHIQTIHDCLEASAGATRRDIAHDCIGIVADPCLEDPENQHTHGMAGCARREEAIWDGLLNDWYAMARDAMPAGVATEYRDVQRLWIKWRDAKCGFAHAKFEGGTAGIPASAYCAMETTAERALELRDLVEEFADR